MPASTERSPYDAEQPRTGPRFSVITAVHNVAGYLPDFIASIEQQTFDLDRVQIIAVDDGSTDDSPALLAEWSSRRPGLVTVLTKENGGQGTARNLGLRHATGEWVTFPDPDDVLRPGYLAAVDAALTREPGAIMAGTKRLLFMEASGEVLNTHPMKRMFDGPDRLIDLRRYPRYAQNSAATGFFRADIIRERGVCFDPRVQPVFEDGHFCISYLLECDEPLVAFVGSAQYLYRKRADSSSTLQISVGDPRRYTDVPKFGYLDVLDRGSRGQAHPPEWLQNIVLYDLSYYFSADLQVARPTAVSGDVAVEFLGYLARIVRFLQPHVIDSYDVKRFDRLWRDILLFGIRGEPWVTPYVVAQARDDVRKLIRVAYRYVGDPPREKVLYRGLPIEPKHHKVCTHRYFDHDLMHERIMWLPADGTLRIEVNDRPLIFRSSWQSNDLTTVGGTQLMAWFDAKRAQPTPARSRRVRAVRAMAAAAPTRRAFDQAWALTDHVHRAGDNAEHLFKYLRANRPDINAWFVLAKGSPDWHRLRAEGHSSRLVAHGSLRWMLLMLNCAHVVSSRDDAAIVRPPELAGYGEPTWKFTFLQRGVTVSDISRWINPKKIDLLVTSTRGEHESFVADGTPYTLTDKEVVLAGMPRLDRLRELGAARGSERADLLLVCPTWRQWLREPAGGPAARPAAGDGFSRSRYWQQWRALLADETLRQAADDAGLTVAFLPHPHVQEAVDNADVPPHVSLLNWVGQDFQSMLARCAALVTDYSSIAFDAAYLARPVVYFQFDRERMDNGAHVSRPGYFDYRRDGFGPVAETVSEAVAAIRSALDTGDGTLQNRYAARADSAFAHRDGLCCARVSDAVSALVPRRPRYSIAWAVARRAAGVPGAKRLTKLPAVRSVARHVRRTA